ncbi:hypothetical protein B6F84_00265 [Acidianus manzaensis]|uniref:Glycoside hydrolase family 15 n=1 Tax=Acidianus manzaensis TaxID=282676 RepID=A0A1W6K3A9_9CREN|nr:hypothetical protein B6F84_00265 [Acidianus manzaensis]
MNQTVNYQINSIKNSTFHLLPEDLSVWEDREAYHFWTEAFNDLGLKDVAIIYSKLNLSNMSILNAQKMLNQSIMKNFVYDSYFASTLETTVEFTSNGSKTILVPYSPFIDSAVILPIDFGLIPLNSNISQSTMGKIQHTLTINGGLARFLGDTYHYDNTLYDSSEPNPPWIITTLFEALYYAKTNNYTEAVNLLTWAYNHSQNGLLPEAVDPKYGNPLPTTSPLTWSSAMFVIVSLNLHNVTHLHTTTSTSTIAKPNGYLDTVIVVVIVIIIILLVIIIKKK